MVDIRSIVFGLNRHLQIQRAIRAALAPVGKTQVIRLAPHDLSNGGLQRFSLGADDLVGPLTRVFDDGLVLDSILQH